MDALDTFIREKPSGCLYHYTGAAGLIGIVQNRKLWASDYRHLNDRNEYRIGARLLQEETGGMEHQQRKVFDKLVADTQKACFVLSFSERGDQLSQWRAYGHGGSGYALGFGQDHALFSSAQQHSFNLIRCEYNPKKQRQLCRYLDNSFTEEMVTKQSWWPGHDTALGALPEILPDRSPNFIAGGGRRCTRPLQYRIESRRTLDEADSEYS